jgi:hypothetical protein
LKCDSQTTPIESAEATLRGESFADSTSGIFALLPGHGTRRPSLYPPLKRFHEGIDLNRFNDNFLKHTVLALPCQGFLSMGFTKLLSLIQ